MPQSKHIPPTDPGPLRDRNGEIDLSYVPDFAHCKLPYSMWYQNDFLQGVRGMRAIEIGIYTVLINEMYDRAAALDLPIKRLARMCGTTPQALNSALENLIEEGKIIRLECGLWNEKVQKIFVHRNKNSEANSNAGRSSAEKRNKINGSNGRPLSDRSTNTEPIQNTEYRDNNSEDKSSSLLSARARDDYDPPDQYQEFLKHHPRPRETSRGEKAWGDALASGQAPEDLIASARRYADASKSFDRDKVQFSDNWLSDRSWAKYPPIKMQSGLSQEERDEHRRDQQVKMIKGGNPSVCSHISAFAAEELVAMKLVTEEQCRKVGVL